MNIFHQICEARSHYLFMYFLCPFHVLSSGTSILLMLVTLIGVPLVCEALSTFVHSFFSFCSPEWIIATHLSSSSWFFFLHLQLLLRSSKWFFFSFQFLYFKFQNLYLFLFHNFYLFINILYLMKCHYHTLIL